MNKLTIFALLVVFHVTVIREVMLECQPLNQNLLKTFSDKVSDELLIWRGSFRYNFYCMKQCLDDLRCITVQYSESSGECRTYAANSAVVESSANIEHQGISTLQLAGRVGYGVKCLNNTECSVVNNSECQGDKCFCKPGDRFNLATVTCDFVMYSQACSSVLECNFYYPVCQDGRCLCQNRYRWDQTSLHCAAVKYNQTCSSVEDCNFNNPKCDDGRCLCGDRYLWDPITLHCAASCTKYGSSFKTYNGFSLANYDLIYDLSGTLNVNNCEDLCKDNTECKSFAFFPSNGHCYLKRVTWLEAISTNRKFESGRVHGERLCAT